MAKRKSRQTNTGKIVVAVLVLLITAIAAVFGWQFNQDEPQKNTNLTVHYIDVGQGDAVLLQTPTGENMLIDAGPGSSEQRLISYLEKVNVDTLDYFILTHPDEDHIGGADLVLAQYAVDAVIMPDCEKDTKAYRNLIAAVEDEECDCLVPVPGDTYSLGDGEMTVLAPLAQKYGSTNDYSVVMRFDYYDNSFLFTGDAELESEEQMLDHWDELTLDCDVLKVGHHGSHTSSSQAFLEAVTPEIAVISCGKSNKYGHPHDETLTKFKNAVVPLYRTDELGDIVLESDGKTVFVTAVP